MKLFVLGAIFVNIALPIETGHAYADWVSSSPACWSLPLS